MYNYISKYSYVLITNSTIVVKISFGVILTARAASVISDSYRVQHTLEFCIGKFSRVPEFCLGRFDFASVFFQGTLVLPW